MTSVSQDLAAWHSGYAAGLAGEPSACPPEILDRLAWQSGYIEGQDAVRKGWIPDESRHSD